MAGMTVGELIEFLKKHQSDMLIVYPWQDSFEYRLLAKEDIRQQELCVPHDGWVVEKKSCKEKDRPTQNYLVLP